MKNNRLAVVILLPKSVSDQIKSIQQKYVNKFWQITMPPHITLARPGTAIVSEKRAVERFKSLKLNSQSIKITANKLDIFLNGPNANVAYIKVDLTPELIKLRQEIYKRASRFMEIASDYPDFVPHVTIANNVAGEQQVDDIIGDAGSKNLNLDFLCDRVHLFKKADQDKKWVWLAERNLSS